MKKYLTTALLFTILSAPAQYADPNFAIPATGYGSNGTHTVGVIAYNNPNFTGHDIKIYYPSDISTPVPTVFYSHAFGGNDPDNIIGVLEFIAKKGYAVVYVPYATTGTTIPLRYSNLTEGFRNAAQDHPDIIDTTRVGFLGHSFGGGASFGIGREFFTVDGWGTNGRFIYALAQWYSYNLEPNELNSFPEDTKVLFEIFNDDVTNDHRMAIDIFNHINIAADEKDFVLVSSSTVNGYTYSAEHNLPNTSAAYDALDYYAYYRLLDALCDYTFNGSAEGKNVALGHGSTAQVTMPTGMGNLQEFENPVAAYPQSQYQYPCADDQNPRIDYCDDTAAITNIIKPVTLLYPNPAGSILTIETTATTGLIVTICNSLGQQTGNYTSAGNKTTIDISYLQRGVYFIFVNGAKIKFIKI